MTLFPPDLLLLLGALLVILALIVVAYKVGRNDELIRWINFMRGDSPYRQRAQPWFGKDNIL